MYPVLNSQLPSSSWELNLKNFKNMSKVLVFLHLCAKPVGHIGMSILLGPLSYSNDLCVYLSANTTDPIITFETR